MRAVICVCAALLFGGCGDSEATDGPNVVTDAGPPDRSACRVFCFGEYDPQRAQSGGQAECRNAELKRSAECTGGSPTYVNSVGERDVCRCYFTSGGVRWECPAIVADETSAVLLPGECI